MKLRRSRRGVPTIRRGNRRVNRGERAARRRRTFRIAKLVAACAVLGFAGHHLARLADSRGWLDPFRVREVRVEGVSLANPNVLVAEAGLMGEELHYWTPLGDYVRRVKRDPLVRGARFQRRFPNRLTLQVDERVPVALIQLVAAAALTAVPDLQAMDTLSHPDTAEGSRYCDDCCDAADHVQTSAARDKAEHDEQERQWQHEEDDDGRTDQRGELQDAADGRSEDECPANQDPWPRPSKRPRRSCSSVTRGLIQLDHCCGLP